MMPCSTPDGRRTFTSRSAHRVLPRFAQYCESVKVELLLFSEIPENLRNKQLQFSGAFGSLQKSFFGPTKNHVFIRGRECPISLVRTPFFHKDLSAAQVCSLEFKVHPPSL